MTRVAVLGHTEWVEFVGVAEPPVPGTITEGTRLFEHAGGGAVVAAAVLAELGAEVDLYTALAGDARGRRARAELEGRGITVHAGARRGETRYAFTTVQAGGERTIVTVGERQAPGLADGLDLGPLRAADGVYATATDAGLLREAARTGALVVTPRIGAPAGFAGVSGIAAVVFSAADPGETGDLDGWARIAGLLIATEGADGGRWREGAGGPPGRGRWSATAPPGPVRDSYGCGDSFAAGVTFGLARGQDVAGACAVGARCGAEILTRVGAPERRDRSRLRPPAAARPGGDSMAMEFAIAN